MRRDIATGGFAYIRHERHIKAPAEVKSSIKMSLEREYAEKFP
jgi:hypothetical protein